MKKIIAATIVCAVSSMTAISHAETPANTEFTAYTELKRGAAFAVSAVTGAVLGGPVGMMVGAWGGAYLGDQLKQADEVESMSDSLATAQKEVEQLHQLLVFHQQQAEELQQLALEVMDLKILFRTGSDTLTEHGQQRVKELAALLARHPQLKVRLDGYADPRGTDEYNNVLAHYRAATVKDALIDTGVKESRIEAYSHGASRSRARQGDLHAYASERRVVIEVLLPEHATALVLSE
jgi:outer membrane protein OmpA-like peptidoglycan-associated protein